jgi:hypothetical protein
MLVADGIIERRLERRFERLFKTRKRLYPFKFVTSEKE